MFGSKSKGIFVDVADGFARMAQTTSAAPPFAIEQIVEIQFETAEDAAEQIRAISGAKNNGFTQAVCSVYPANRLVSRVSIDPRKFREPEYLEKHVEETLKIGLGSYSLFTLSTGDGSDVSVMKTPPKEILVCGAPTEQLVSQQERLLDLGLYPDRMEIGTISSVGGIVHGLRMSDSKNPTLVLEIGAESTNVFVVTREGIEVTRSVGFGIQSILPQVKSELGLKDEEAARKLFFSNNFDFTGMAPQLLKRIIRELQASIGFYEVQTGQSVTQLCCTLLAPTTAWMEKALADVLGMRTYSANFSEWLASLSIECGPGVNLSNGTNGWINLISLMGNFNSLEHEAAA